jgi:hypothetical protein
MTEQKASEIFVPRNCVQHSEANVKDVEISVFAFKCLEILEQVRLTSKPIRVVRDGMPIAEIAPIVATMDRAKWFGSLRGQMEILGEIMPPSNNEDDWNCLRD